MNWLHYLLEANLYLGVFYLCYCLFLNKETYYTLNRIYLILTCIISFIIPIVQLGILKPAEPVVQSVIVITTPNILKGTISNHIITAGTHFKWADAIVFIYLMGAITLIVIFIIKLYQLAKLINSKPAIIHDRYKLICINESNSAFSFFNYLFIGTNTQGTETIIRHELVHIRQKHSIDIILLEIVKIINWFNPLVYLLQNSLKNLHEYIADKKAASSETDVLSYSSFLVSNAYGVGGFSITHSFFNHNLLKKRIIMLNQKRSGSLARLKYLVAFPLCVAMLCISTLAFSKSYGWLDIISNKSANLSIAKTNTSKTIAYVSVNTEVKKAKPNNVTSGKSLTKPKKLNNIVSKSKSPIAAISLPARVDSNSKKSPETIYRQLAKTVRYPTEAFKNDVVGRAILTFTVDAENKVQNVTILRGPTQSMNNEAARALQACNASGLSQGIKYTIPISFVLIDKKGNYIVGHEAPVNDTNDQKGDNNQVLNNESVQYLNEVVVAGYK